MKNKSSVTAFADLATIKKTLADQERLAALALAAQQAQEAARLAHKNLFANAAGKVSKLADKHVGQHAAMLKKPPPAPVPRRLAMRCSVGSLASAGAGGGGRGVGVGTGSVGSSAEAGRLTCAAMRSACCSAASCGWLMASRAWA